MMKSRAMGAGFLLCTIIMVGCSDTSDRYREQLAMLEETGASDSEKCKLAKEATTYAFENLEKEDFREWKNISQKVCNKVDSEESEKNPTAENGKIKGSYSYPSDYIPDDIEACVSNIDTNQMTCGPTRSGDEFTFDLPPGKYRIWAQTEDNAGYRAYYSQAVRCGLTASCNDHTPIVLNLEAGETIDGVRPHDWYAY